MNAIEFLRFIVSSLVINVSAIEITEKQDELGTLLSLRIDPADMWSIIGRGGKTIDSIRTVLRVYGAKHSLRLNLRIIEDPKIV
jgi:predicted RNA-binding protein YlqC (UPF0109 family)